MKPVSLLGPRFNDCIIFSVELQTVVTGENSDVDVPRGLVAAVCERKGKEVTGSLEKIA